MKGGESCLDKVSAPGSTVPGTEKPPMERRVANVPVAKARQRRKALDPLVAPHGAPFPCLCRGREGRKDGPPRGPGKEYGQRSVG